MSVVIQENPARILGQSPCREESRPQMKESPLKLGTKPSTMTVGPFSPWRIQTFPSFLFSFNVSLTGDVERFLPRLAKEADLSNIAINLRQNISLFLGDFCIRRRRDLKLLSCRLVPLSPITKAFK